jgi:hypothetical protein
LLDKAWDLTKNTVEHMIDGASYAGSSLLSAFANGVKYGYKDLTHDYNGRAPWIPQSQRFHPYGYSFKKGFQKEDVSFNYEDRISPANGKRLLTGTTTILLPPFISPAPRIPNLLNRFGFQPAITYPLNHK